MINNKLININNSDDMFYRYKMPIISINHQGKGNGKFTDLTNIVDIANAINIPVKILLQYITISLGTNFKNNIINGHYTQEMILDLIIKFNKVFILCQKCGIPELEPSIEGKKKNSILIVKCSACGEQYELKSDNKLNNKIIDCLKNYYKDNKFIKTNGNV